jgi:hypothetical protein
MIWHQHYKKYILDDQGESRQMVHVVVLEASKVSVPVKLKKYVGIQ